MDSIWTIKEWTGSALSFWFRRRN